jgi:hypothetical protein
MVQAVPLETSLWIAYPFTGWAKEPSCFSVLRSKNFVLMRLLFLELVLKPERLAYPQPVVQPPEVSYQNEKPEGLTHHRLRSKYRFNWELCRPFRPLRFKDMLTGPFGLKSKSECHRSIPTNGAKTPQNKSVKLLNYYLSHSPGCASLET